MRKDKAYIYKLRQEGKSYREIQKLTGVSRGTLVAWFKDIEWSRHLKVQNTERQLEGTKERLAKMNMVRKLKLQFHYAKAEKEAADEFQLYKDDPLFHAGLMLYAGEGTKTTGDIRLANINFDIHKLFIAFCLKYLQCKREDLRVSLLLYPDLDVETCLERWSAELGISKTQFHKTQVIQGREKVRRLHFGVGTTILCGAYTKKKLMKWLELVFAQYNRIDDAAIV